MILLSKTANKKSSPKADLTEGKFAGNRQRKSVAPKGRRKCADLRGQIADSYSARCRPVESISTGGSSSRVEK